MLPFLMYDGTFHLNPSKDYIYINKGDIIYIYCSGATLSNLGKLEKNARTYYYKVSI